MNNFIKKVTAVLATTAITFSLGLPAFAAEINEPTMSVEAMQIQNMSDEEFDAFVVRTVNDKIDAGKSEAEIQAYFAQLGLEFDAHIDDISNYSISPDRGLTPSIFAMKRGNEKFHRVYAQAKFNEKELRPAIEDIMSLEWDTSKVTYDGCTAGDFTSKRGESNPNAGIIFFNVNDSSMGVNDIAYGVAHLILNSGAKNIHVQTTYIHTYNTTDVTWSGGIEIKYDKALQAGGSFSLSGSNQGHIISFWEDNHLNYTN